MSSQHPTDRTDPATRPSPEGVAHAPGCGCLSRRQTFVVAGTAVAGTLGLTACGAAEDAARGAASSAASAASSAASSAAGRLVAAVDVPVGGGKVFPDLEVVVTQPTEGDFKAFSFRCPHQGCPLQEVAGGTINCTGACGHGSAFDIATGEVRKGPATSPLEAKSVSVGADGITVT